VRLQLEPVSYRKAVSYMVTTMVREAGVHFAPGAPFEWQMHRFDLHDAGLPVQLVGTAPALASTVLLSQYAYRDDSVPAGPRPGDVAIDGGGCWGETALWLAHKVGPEGVVHSFEPTPCNLAVLHSNLQANPELAARINVHPAALGDSTDEQLWLTDRLEPGVGMKTGEQIAQVLAQTPGAPVVAVSCDTIDALVAREGLPRVDFIKLDVEHAELAVLRGAAQTIAAHRPRLAISIYHNADDLATIPAYVASLGVPYRWYLQCSTMTDIDTVAFAVPIDG
jgi:FkbM family methyltransferase